MQIETRELTTCEVAPDGCAIPRAQQSKLGEALAAQPTPVRVRRIEKIS